MTREEVVRSTSYWLTHLHGDVFRLLNEYMTKNSFDAQQAAKGLDLPPRFIKEVLSESFNPSLYNLLGLALTLGCVTVVKFVPVEEFLKAENESTIIS